MPNRAAGPRCTSACGRRRRPRRWRCSPTATRCVGATNAAWRSPPCGSGSASALASLRRRRRRWRRRAWNRCWSKPRDPGAVAPAAHLSLAAGGGHGVAGPGRALLAVALDASRLARRAAGARPGAAGPAGPGAAGGAGLAGLPGAGRAPGPPGRRGPLQRPAPAPAGAPATAAAGLVRSPGPGRRGAPRGAGRAGPAPTDRARSQRSQQPVGGAARRVALAGLAAPLAAAVLPAAAGAGRRRLPAAALGALSRPGAAAQRRAGKARRTMANSPTTCCWPDSTPAPAYNRAPRRRRRPSAKRSAPG